MSNLLLESNEKIRKKKSNLNNNDYNINNIIGNNDEINKITKENSNIISENNNNEIKSQKSFSKNIIEKSKKSNIIEEERNPEDPLISYITSKRKREDEEIENASKWIVEEIEGDLFKDKK